MLFQITGDAVFLVAEAYFVAHGLHVFPAVGHNDGMSGGLHHGQIIQAVAEGDDLIGTDAQAFCGVFQRNSLGGPQRVEFKKPGLGTGD